MLLGIISDNLGRKFTICKNLIFLKIFLVLGLSFGLIGALLFTYGNTLLLLIIGLFFMGFGIYSLKPITVVIMKESC